MTIVHLSSRHTAGRDVGTSPAADWRLRGACREEDPELFFPLGVSGAAVAQAEEAKRVCRGCPVMDECRAWADANKVTDGVWGGMSEEDRQRPKRAAERARQRTAIDDGLELALAHGCDILVAHRQGQDERTITHWTHAPVTAVRWALRFLLPPTHLRGLATALERLMAQAGVVQDMVRDGRTDADVARMMHTYPRTVGLARRLLAHREAAEQRTVATA